MSTPIPPLKCQPGVAIPPAENAAQMFLGDKMMEESQGTLAAACDSITTNLNYASFPFHSDEVLISELADDPDMAELIRMYVGKFTSKINSMTDYLANNRLDELARLAHQLKGTGGGYGFPSISDAAWRVEQEAKSNSDLQQIRTAVADLTELCQRAIAGCIEPIVREPHALGTGFNS
jgi:HPt (histidine-containing phosphotransfer) domain-containing protein